MNLRTMRMLNHVFLDTAGADGAQGGGGGGQGGPGAAAGGGNASAEGGAGEGGAAGGGGGSFLSNAGGGGQGGAPGGAAAAAINEVISEKYRVNKADGSFDLEASTRKLQEGYSNLEKKLGSAGQSAPETPDAYAPEVKLEGFKWDEFKGDARMQNFLKGAHAEGISNKQLSFLLTEYVPALQAATQGNHALTMEQCDTELRGHWKDEAAFTANLHGALRVAGALGEKAGITMQDIDDAGLGNNPLFIRLLAPFAKELGEASSPDGGNGGQGGTDAQTLMQSEAYKNPNHPDHARVSAQVSAHYQRKFPSTP